MNEVMSPINNVPTNANKRHAKRKSKSRNANNNSNPDNAPASAANSTSAAVLKPNLNRRAVGANWQKAMNIAATSSTPAAVAPTVEEHENRQMNNSEHDNPSSSEEQVQVKRKKPAPRDKYVAMDCEMVGVGIGGQEDMLARVSIVDRKGKVLLDKYVKPRENITDYRTAVSGIRPHDLVDAEAFDAVQDEVVQLLQNRILVGHNIKKDLQVLHIKHPYLKIRDTSNYKPLCRLVSNGRTPSLKRLTEAILGMEIQSGEHNSVEDARAAMSIYNRLAVDWEQHLYAHNKRRRQ